MPNPLKINITTGSTSQFGFKATFDFFESKLNIDFTDLTIGTYSGISVSVIDGYGNELNGVPNLPSGEDVIIVDLQSGDFKYTDYKIKAILTDTDSKTYTVEVNKNVCKPKDSEHDAIKGSFSHVVDCKQPLLTISDTTAYNYLSKKPTTTTKNYAIRLPNTDLETIKNIAQTPIAIKDLYSGDYLIKGYTNATFDLDDNIEVIIRYEIVYQFNVTCENRLCEVVCCYEKLQSDLDNCKASSAEKKSLENKMTKVSALMLQAIALADGCGKSNKKQVDEIKSILNCSCDGCGGNAIEGDPQLLNTFNTYNFDKDCFNVSVIGGVTQISCKSNASSGQYQLEALDTDCGAVVKIVPTKVGDNTTYKIGVDCDALYDVISNFITTDVDLINIINNNFDINGKYLSVDAKCLGTATTWDYTAEICECTNQLYFSSIDINSAIYAPTSPIPTGDYTAIKSFLNSLGLGVFDVYPTTIPCPIEKGACGTLVKISSANNSNQLIAVDYNDAGANSYVASFSKKNRFLLSDLVQKIVNKICNLCITDVKACKEYNVCSYVCEHRYSVTSDLSQLAGAFATINGGSTPILLSSLSGYRVITTVNPIEIATSCDVVIDSIITATGVALSFSRGASINGGYKFFYKKIVTIPIGGSLDDIISILIVNGCSILDWLESSLVTYNNTDTIDLVFDPNTKELEANANLEGIVAGIVADEDLFDDINKQTTFEDTDTVDHDYDVDTDTLTSNVIVDGVLDEIINNPTLKAKFCTICDSGIEGFKVQVDSNSFIHSFSECEACAAQYKREVFINGNRMVYVGCTGTAETIDDTGGVFGEEYGSMNITEGQTYSFLFRGTAGDCTPTITCAGVFSVVFYDALNVQVGATINVDVSTETPPEDCYLVQNITVPTNSVSMKITIS